MLTLQTGSALNEPDKLRDSETDSAGLMRLPVFFLFFVFFPSCVIQGPNFTTYKLKSWQRIYVIFPFHCVMLSSFCWLYWSFRHASKINIFMFFLCLFYWFPCQWKKILSHLQVSSWVEQTVIGDISPIGPTALSLLVSLFLHREKY